MRRVVLASCGRHGAILAQVPDAKAASVASLLASKRNNLSAMEDSSVEPSMPLTADAVMTAEEPRLPMAPTPPRRDPAQ
jgi:hypothetical protein